MIGVLAGCLLFLDLALPPLECIDFLPDRESLWKCCHANCDYHRDLRFFIDVIGQTKQTREATAELRWLYQLYDDGRDCHSPMYTVLEKRVKLWRIMEKIGWDGLVEGDWPPPVPVWRMR